MAIALLALAALFAAASACPTPPGGCIPAICKKLKTLSISDKGNPLYGFQYGVWNKNVPKNKENKKGGPVVSYEYFTEVGKNGSYLGTSTAKNLGDCCTACAKTKGCLEYQFFPSASVSAGKKAVPGFKAGTQCYLLTGGSELIPGGPPYGAPFSGQYERDQKKAMTMYDASWVGGSCNPGKPGVQDDPHFTGAMGTRFDFNGELNKPFCLISDKDFHINVMLKGYEDQTTEKGLRSWIKEVGLMWTVNGKTHTVHMAARAGKQQGRGKGFMSYLAVDDKAVDVPSTVGQEAKGDGFSLKYVGMEKMGPYEVESFVATIAGVATLNVRMRVAHPQLQTPTDAEAHFNIEVAELKQTPQIHGVLGQTFRHTAAQVKKALKYSELVELLHAPIRADGETGKGFLEGSVKDYEASSILAADCGFSAFSH